MGKAKILKKVKPYLKEGDKLKEKKEYEEAVRSYREGISILRIKGTDLEDREEEVEKIMDLIDKAYSSQIDDIIENAEKLREKQDFTESNNALKAALEISYNIRDENLRYSKTEEINHQTSLTELEELIQSGKVALKNQNFNDAIDIFKETLKDAKKIFSSDLDNKLIQEIKLLINKTYNENFNGLVAEADDFFKNNKPKEALELYKVAEDIAREMYSSELKDINMTKIKTKINEVYISQILTLIDKGKTEINSDKIDDGLKTLREAYHLASDMFDSEEKKNYIDQISNLANPILIKRIKPIQNEGEKLIKQENYEESIKIVQEAAKTFTNALNIAEKMIESSEKDRYVEKLDDLINETCTSGINIRINKSKDYVNEESYDKAISEMYSALSIAKNMPCAEDDNIEIEKIKDSINQIYLAEIDSIVKEGKNLLVEKKFEEARKIFSDALSITNKMYLSKEMDRQVSRIKNLLYKAEMKQVVSDGFIEEEQMKFEEKLEELKKELEKAELITDPEERNKKISDVKHLIDNVYADQINLLIEQCKKRADEGEFETSMDLFKKALKFIDLIEYLVVKDNQLVKISNANISFSVLSGNKRNYSKGIEFLDEALKIIDKIENPKLIDEQIVKTIKIIKDFGIELAKAEKFKECYEKFDKALEVSKKFNNSDLERQKQEDILEVYVRELNNEALIQLKNKNYEHTLESCKKAIELDDSIQKTYFLFGNAYLGLNQFKEAIDKYEKAVELSPEDKQAWNNMGLAQEFGEQLDSAIKSFEKAVELDDTFSEAWYNMANCYFLKKDLDNAEKFYEKSLEIYPDYANSRLFIGEIKFKKKNYDSALEYVKKAIELDDRISSELKNLVGTYENTLHSINEKLSELFKKREDIKI
ncbi:MAG: tetratricopeptide repeat protein [Candidatus Lokiarchaeota archaeon]|nr:tetratricopeptide repeat protein [Candidatus Lokiarchaeota archaeon]MBD3341082.1 tetratricopeptide repeat protein [Candidatus Lokiarchaeota archaeon]